MIDQGSADQDLKTRLDFIGMDAATRDTLARLRPLIQQAIGPALDLFYQKIKATPETKAFFQNDAHMAGAKQAQQGHWATITTGRYTADYVQSVLRIGRTHARIGLEPRWYIGGYIIVIEQLIHAIVKEQWPRLLQMTKAQPEAMANSVSALVKAAMLDMDFAISTYIETLDEERRKAELAQKLVLEEATEAAQSLGLGLSGLAAKNLTYRMSANIPQAYRTLQVDFNAALGQIEDAMLKVNGSVGAIQSGMREISAAADDLSRRTEQQASTLQQTAAGLDQITATVKKSAEGADHARDVVATANQDAQNSVMVVRKTVDAMDAIAKSAQQISRIIGVIDEIAFQTNLLALNAGVEAARAGEAGRGFAVVASEVRSLAQRSAEAAKEIKNLISASNTQVEQGVKMVGATGNALENIMAQVNDINRVVEEIATGAREQALGLAEINAALNQMDHATQQNAAMVEQSTAASQMLAKETDRLSDLIGQFRITNAA